MSTIDQTSRRWRPPTSATSAAAPLPRSRRRRLRRCSAGPPTPPCSSTSSAASRAARGRRRGPRRGHRHGRRGRHPVVVRLDETPRRRATPLEAAALPNLTVAAGPDEAVRWSSASRGSTERPARRPAACAALGAGRRQHPRRQRLGAVAFCRHHRARRAHTGACSPRRPTSSPASRRASLGGTIDGVPSHDQRARGDGDSTPTSPITLVPAARARDALFARPADAGAKLIVGTTQAIPVPRHGRGDGAPAAPRPAGSSARIRPRSPGALQCRRTPSEIFSPAPPASSAARARSTYEVVHGSPRPASATARRSAWAATPCTASGSSSRSSCSRPTASRGRRAHRRDGGDDEERRRLASEST